MTDDTPTPREYARKLLENSGKDWRWKHVFEGLLSEDVDDPGEFAHAVLAELETAQVTATWPEPAACCPHCPHREDPPR